MHDAKLLSSIYSSRESWLGFVLLYKLQLLLHPGPTIALAVPGHLQVALDGSGYIFLSWLFLSWASHILMHLTCILCSNGVCLVPIHFTNVLTCKIANFVILCVVSVCLCVCTSAFINAFSCWASEAVFLSTGHLYSLLLLHYLLFIQLMELLTSYRSI